MGMIFSYIAMAVGLIGLIVCSKKQQTNPALKPLAFVCLLVVVAGLGWIIYERLFYDKSAALMDRELQFKVACADHVGKIIKEKNFNKVVFIANAGWDADEFQKKNVEAVTKAIEKASGATVTVIAPPMPQGEDAIPEDVDAKGFNELTKDVSEAAVVVEAMLPMTQEVMRGKSRVVKDPQEKLEIFAAARKNLVILFNNEPESRPGIKKIVDAGNLIWISQKPTPRPKKKGQKIKPIEPTGDLEKDFNARYEVFGKDNYGDFFKVK